MLSFYCLFNAEDIETDQADKEIEYNVDINYKHCKYVLQVHANVCRTQYV